MVQVNSEASQGYREGLKLFRGRKIQEKSPNPTKKIPPTQFFFILRIFTNFANSPFIRENLQSIRIFFGWVGNRRCYYTSWAKPLEARGEAASS